MLLVFKFSTLKNMKDHPFNKIFTKCIVLIVFTAFVNVKIIIFIYLYLEILIIRGKIESSGKSFKSR